MGVIRQGKLMLEDRRAFDAWARAQREGLQVRVSVKRRPRSLSQNSYYWAVVVATFAEFTGYTVEEMHEVLKAHILGREMKKIGKREVWCTRSSTALDSKEFAEFVDQAIALAATEYGVAIPPPDRRQA